MPENDTIERHLADQSEWSARTFGHGTRTKGVLLHIQKELDEIADNPHDLEEWIDVILLAMDGYWRHGGEPKDILRRLRSKLLKNMERKWPSPISQDVPVEHIAEEA